MLLNYYLPLKKEHNSLFECFLFYSIKDTLFADVLFVCLLVCLFVCLFAWGLSSHSRIFHSYRDVTITGEGLQILTFARYSWPLSSEVSLACHIYCDMGHPFIMVISEDPWYSHLLQSLWQWSCHYLFLRLWSVAAGIWKPNLPIAGQTLKPTAPPPR